MTEILPIDPAWLALICVTILAGIECNIIRKIVRVSRNYARMSVEKARITADGTITLNEPDIIPFIKDTFAFMNEIEGIVSWLFGLIINHPSTGWIRGYGPEIKEFGEAFVNVLASSTEAPTSDPNVATNPVSAQTPEQPVQPVNQPTGA